MNSFDFLNTMLAEGVTDGCFPGAVAAVGVGEQTLVTAASGEATLDTRFDMASMSKILSTTMLALQAIEEGLLTLDDTLSYFFDTPDDKARITVRQLLTHTGGFTPFFLLQEAVEDPADAVSCILRRPLESEPGGAPCYSCMGFILLGKLLEEVFGAPLDTLASARVFSPLSMHRTGYNPSGSNIAPTEVDIETGRAWQGIVHDENARFLGGVSGNAGVFSDIKDCIRFASMLATGGRRFLSSAVFHLATQDHTRGYDTHRGLGFHLGGTPGSFFGDLFPPVSFGHTGFTGVSMVIDPATSLFVILLTNRVYPTRTNEKIFRFRRRLHNRIYAAYTRSVTYS